MFNKYKRGRLTFSCGRLELGQLPIYFDHKIADDISVFPRLMSFGLVPPDFEYNFIRNFNFISSEESGSHMKNCYGAHTPAPHTETDGKCYKTFYKQIKYTYKGRLIDMTEEEGYSSNMLYQIAQYNINTAKGGARKTFRRKVKGIKRLTKIKGRRW